MKRCTEISKIQLTDFLPKGNTEFRQNVATAEIKLVLRMLDTNQSFKSMDSIAKFNSSIFPDSKIAKSVSKICFKFMYHTVEGKYKLCQF